MSLIIGGKAWEAPPAPPRFVRDVAEERAVEALQACHEAVCAIHKIERRLEKRWAWRERHQHEQDTPLYQERIALIHDDFAEKHGAWRRLVKASARLQKELEPWPKKEREAWCGAWGVEWPCEVFSYQMETSLEGTPFRDFHPF